MEFQFDTKDKSVFKNNRHWGDAFTAAIAIRYLQGGTLEDMSVLANRLGSWVASHTGPTPELDKEIKRYLK
jgi:sugar/nucleoside kinase (ribokinase family)